MLAHAFHHGQSATITHGEALSRASGDVELARGGTIQDGVTGKNIAAARGRRAGANGNRATRQTFAHVVIGFAGQAERDTFGEESAKTLSRGAVKFAGVFVANIVGKSTSMHGATHQFSAEAGADTAVRIAN